MTGDTRQGLQGQVHGEDLGQHASRVNVVGEIAAGVLVIQLIEVHLAAVGEGGVTDVVTQCNGLDEVEVEVEGATDGAGNTGHQLHVETAAGDVVILGQREHLSLVGVAVVVGGIQDFIDILGKGGTPYGVRLTGVETAQSRLIVERKIRVGMGLFLLLHTLR